MIFPFAFLIAGVAIFAVAFLGNRKKFCKSADTTARQVERVPFRPGGACFHNFGAQLEMI